MAGAVVIKIGNFAFDPKAIAKGILQQSLYALGDFRDCIDMSGERIFRHHFDSSTLGASRGASGGAASGTTSLGGSSTTGSLTLSLGVSLGAS